MKETIAVQNRIVWPRYLNDRGNLFGGECMKWMDEVAYIAAKRFTRKNMVTVSVGKIRFIAPAKEGDMVNVKAEIAEVGRVKLTVQCFIEKIDIQSELSETIVEATFIFAAVDETGSPVRL
jgi:acyl-CoA hydrolase